MSHKKDNKESTNNRSGNSESKRESKSESKSESKKEQKREPKREPKREQVEQSDEDVIDLCDDHDYQVLSAVFETDSGRNVAEILSRLQKDVHLLATSVHQLIQLSLASQQVNRNQEESDGGRSSDDGDDDGDDGEDNDE